MLGMKSYSQDYVSACRLVPHEKQQMFGVGGQMSVQERPFHAR
jgi:hypothetical protein